MRETALRYITRAGNWCGRYQCLYDTTRRIVFADAADGDSRIPESEGVNVLAMPEHYGLLSPVLHVVALQLLAYHVALVKGTDVDKPRNLAKSVTVE